MMAIKRPSYYQLYLFLVALAGLLLLSHSLLALTVRQPDLRLGLLLGMVLASAFATTSTRVKNTGITYATSAAISLAAAAIWSIDAAILLMTVDTLCIWLLKPTDATTWKKKWSQLAFNLGMLNLAMWAGGTLLLFLLGYLSDLAWPLQLLAWVAAAFVYAEVNLWLLLIIVRLQNGPSVDLRQMWRSERWATQIDVLILSIGGASLAFATERFGTLGTLAFFLPILLSAYAFHLYVREMQTHMNNLESIVAARTQELAHHAELLTKLNREKDSFLAVLTHDMITPLTAMQMATDLLQSNPHLVLENPELLPLIQRNQQTLFQITQNILDISKLQANATITISKEIYDLTEQLEEVVNQMRLTAQTKAIDFVLETSASPLLVYADPLQLERIIFNLLSNAIKYSFKESTVTIRAKRTHDAVLIEVADQGYGISPEDLAQIFDRFYRVGEHRGKAVGTGLGLAIVKVLAEAHDGTVTVTSTPRVGSIFTVTLPTPEFG